MKVLLIGPPGVGKGTQSSLLQKTYGFKALSSGEILRQEVASKSELGCYAKSFLDAGELLPDAVIVKIMVEYLHRPEFSESSILLDGFPRTVGQAQELDRVLAQASEKIEHVFIFTAPKEIILERLGGRLWCSQCGAIYHKKNHPPIKENTCDQCGTSLVIRADDQEEAILNRLDVYEKNTAPLMTYYQKSGSMHIVESSKSTEDVFMNLKNILGDKI